MTLQRSLPLLWVFVYESESLFSVSLNGILRLAKEIPFIHFDTLVQVVSLLGSAFKCEEHVPWSAQFTQSMPNCRASSDFNRHQ